MLDGPSLAYLAYRPGVPPIAAVWSLTAQFAAVWQAGQLAAGLGATQARVTGL